MDRVFLDANVLFSAAYRPDSGLRHLWALTKVELVTSVYALEEARANLESDQQRDRLGELMRQVSIIMEAADDRVIPPSLRLAEKDRPILAAAIGAGASHLLTGDAADFGLHFGRTVQGVRILRPAEYFRQRK